MSVGQTGPSPGSGPSRRAVEVGTAVIVALIVASGVVAVGVVTRDDPQNAADTGPSDSPSETPDSAEPQTSPPEDGTESDDEPSDDPPEEPNAEPAEVTDVELTVDQSEYTGRCPVTLVFSARVTTNTGPVRADLEWRDAASNEVHGERVQFGGPGPDAEPVPQGVTVTHEVEVADDATVQRTVAVIDPNEVTSNTVDATVTCTPYAEITKGGDDFDAAPADGLCHELHFEATITVPHDMTVTYEWLRSDGATDATGPHKEEFSGGGMQTKSIPGKTWNLGALDGEYGYELRIIEPYDVTTDMVAYDVSGCSGPAT